jgi:hypothetical protein
MGYFTNLDNVTSVKSFDGLNENRDVDMDLVFVLDKSGSMWGLEKDTIGGFNSFIEKEKAKNQNTRVTLVLFDDEYKILYTRKPIDDVEELTSEEYYADGCTALLDAVGRTIVSLDGEVCKKVMFVITTDGLENASTKFTRADVKKLINDHPWEFLFIGADIDSYAEAATLGIESDRTANYEKSSAGLGALFSSVSSFKEEYEECEEDEEVDGIGWKKLLD